MKLRTIHREVGVNPELHPDPLVFEPVGGGYFEGEVPDEVGNYLLSIGRPGEYVIAPPEEEGKAKPEKDEKPEKDKPEKDEKPEKDKPEKDDDEDEEPEKPEKRHGPGPGRGRR